MIATIEHQNRKFKVDLHKPIDISMPLLASEKCASAWYVNPMTIEPVMANGFVGSVQKGGAVNFRNIFFNPHGNGTHTECVGHIAEEVHSLNKNLTQFYFIAKLISVKPTELENDVDLQKKGDHVITLEQIKDALGNDVPEAIIIRTFPNPSSKKEHNYSETNPPYLCDKAAKFIHDVGIKHLLIDLPSVDAEVDGGRLLSHRAFWNYPENTKMDRTITELIYVEDAIKDGEYFLSFQITSLENDASPSKPILFQIENL